MNKNHSNPFSDVGKAVQEKNFIGRKDELSTLISSFDDDGMPNIAIVGLPKVGKTSLMNKFASVVEREFGDEYLVVKISLTSPEDSSSEKSRIAAARGVFFEIIHALTRLLNSKGYIPTELKDHFMSFEQTLIQEGLPWAVAKTTIEDFLLEVSFMNKKVIVCIDEFDYCRDYFDSCHFDFLRTISYDGDERISIITTSRRDIKDIERSCGGGSTFFQVCNPLYLNMFSENDVQELRKQVGELSPDDASLINDNAGSHPYLNALILKDYLISHNVEDSIDNVFPAIYNYYENLITKHFKKDELDEKVVNVYSGFLDYVTKEEEDYILKRYGLFKEVLVDDESKYISFCSSFDDYMKELYRKNPYGKFWPITERAIRKVINYALERKFGRNLAQWKKYVINLFGPYDQNTLTTGYANEQRRRKHLASKNITDQLYPKHYFVIIKDLWNNGISSVLKHDLTYWEGRFNLLSTKIRNPEAHSRLYVDEEIKSKASTICQEIIKSVDQYKWDINPVEPT